MMKKNKRPVFLIVQHLRSGGIEVLALDLLKQLRGRRDLHIVALEGIRKETLENWPLLHAYRDRLHFINKKAGLSPLTLFKLVMVFVRYRPLAVHTHHIGPMIYGGLAARLSGIRNLIHTEHDGWHLQDNGQLQSRVMKWLKPSIVAVAHHVSTCVAKQCAAPLPRVVYNGIDMDKFSVGDKNMARLCQYLPQNVRIIGCAGRMEEVKGQRYLIEALQYLPDDVHVAFAGDGSLKDDLKSYALELGLKDRTHFQSHVDDMRSFYRSLDVFCLPSLNEGFPLSPLEAQSCGIPAVLSDVGGCCEALCRDTGFLAEAGNVQDLARNLTQALAQEVKQSPRQFILENFDLNDVAMVYDTLYTQVEKQSEPIGIREMSYV